VFNHKAQTQLQQTIELLLFARQQVNPSVYQPTIMASPLLLVVAAVIALGAGHGAAYDPNPLQDFCVADTTSKGLIDDQSTMSSFTSFLINPAASSAQWR